MKTAESRIPIHADLPVYPMPIPISENTPEPITWPKAMEYSSLFPSVRFRSSVVSIFFSLFSMDNPPLLIGRPVPTVPCPGLRLHTNRSPSSDLRGPGNATGLSFKPQDGSAPAASSAYSKSMGYICFPSPSAKGSFPFKLDQTRPVFYSDCNLHMLSIENLIQKNSPFPADILGVLLK